VVAESQAGFLDIDERRLKLSAKADSLERLNTLIDFKVFRTDLGRLECPGHFPASRERTGNDQAACNSKFAKLVDGWNSIFCRERDDSVASRVEIWVRSDKHCPDPVLDKRRESSVQLRVQRKECRTAREPFAEVAARDIPLHDSPL
jgi:hypothetical protein